MIQIFISYSRDDEDKAFALKDRLRDRGIEVFIDVAGISPGDEWRDKLQKEIDESFAVVLICTNASMSSHEVTFEWAYALGRGIPVIPIKYEADCVLHTRLQVLQQLDFSNPRERSWDKLIYHLELAKNQINTTNTDSLNTIGISEVIFGREKLSEKYSTQKVIQRVEPNSELLVIARSCEAWARQYDDLQKVINQKHVRVRLAMVDPALPKERWMISKDYARLDAQTTLDKLQMIKIDPLSKGFLELYWLVGSPLFSFVHFMSHNKKPVGILEIGASLSLEERVALILNQGTLLNRIYKIHIAMLESIQPTLRLEAGG